MDAYEQAKWFGDDLALKADFRTVDLAGAAAKQMFVLRHLGGRRSVRRRVGTGVEFFRTGGVQDAAEMIGNHWRASDELAERLGFDGMVRRSIEQTFERWDGHGVPQGAKGADILTTSQLVNIADVIEVYARFGGVEAACSVAQDRSGSQFSPNLV